MCEVLYYYGPSTMNTGWCELGENLRLVLLAVYLHAAQSRCTGPIVIYSCHTSHIDKWATFTGTVPGVDVAVGHYQPRGLVSWIWAIDPYTFYVFQTTIAATREPFEIAQ